MKTKVPVLIIGILLILIAVPFLLPSSVYKNLFESKLEETTGLDFNFDNGFSFSLLPAIRLDAKDVLFNGKIGQDVQIVGTIQRLHLDMQLWKFLRGDVNVDSFLIVEPKITVEGDFTPYIPDWLRKNLSASRKNEIRYIEILQHFIEDSIFKTARVEEARFLWKKTQSTTIDIEKATLDISKPAHNKDFSINGNAYVNKRTLDIKIRLERPDDFLRGYRSKMDLAIDSAPIRIDYNGSAAKRQTFVSQGNLRVDIPSLFDFCNWFTDKDKCTDKQGNLLILSDLKIRDQRLQIEDASYTQSPFSAKARGVIDFKTSKPEISGTITIPGHALSGIEPDFDHLRTIDLNQFFLDTFRANVDVLYGGYKLSTGDILKPKLKIRHEDGRLSLSVDQLHLLGGLANARVRWHKGLENGYMDARIDLSSINLEKLQQELGQKTNILGVLNTSIEIQSEGSTLVALMETATIRGDFSVLDGSIINNKIASALNARQSEQFDFAELKGRVQGNRGQLISENLSFVAPSVNVNGRMNYDFINNALKLTLNSVTQTKEGPSNGYIQIDGPLDDLSLETSKGKKVSLVGERGLLSGLLPYEEENQQPALGDEEFVIEETDLLD
ncbi:MAG: AsmA family protein [Terasakiella sp.]|uniref:AsmA family protein n=1 Tax=unclassified Terasakiella TaxID=2614952 RepID=UPI003AFF9C4F